MNATVIDSYLTRHEAHCERRHRTYGALARCTWPRTRVVGEGPFAVIAACGDSPTVLLWPTAEHALDFKLRLDADDDCHPSRHGMRQLNLSEVHT